MPALLAEAIASKILVVDDEPSRAIPTRSSPTYGGLGFRLRAQDDARPTPAAVITADDFLDDPVSAESHERGLALGVRPLWLEDLVGPARTLPGAPH